MSVFMAWIIAMDASMQQNMSRKLFFWQTGLSRLGRPEAAPCFLNNFMLPDDACMCLNPMLQQELSLPTFDKGLKPDFCRVCTSIRMIEGRNVLSVPPVWKRSECQSTTRNQRLAQWSKRLMPSNQIQICWQARGALFVNATECNLANAD